MEIDDIILSIDFFDSVNESNKRMLSNDKLIFLVILSNNLKSKLSNIAGPSLDSLSYAIIAP